MGYARFAVALVLVLLTLLVPSLANADEIDRFTNWPTVNNDRSGTRFSPLTQINRDNVKTLSVAWTYNTGDAGDKTTIECTPIVIDGVMYLTTVKTRIVALDATTGKEMWSFDPYLTPTPYVKASGGVNRGVAFWSDNQPKGTRRILAGLSEGRLMSLDANTGKLDPAFGNNGIVDLRADLEGDLTKVGYGPTSAPIVFEDLVILGFSNPENHPSAPGDTRAFDVRTGKQVWRFHTVPRPGEAGHESWQNDEWKNRGGANAWGGFTLDESTATLFFGTGCVAPDFYGAKRKGANLFGNCVLAIDARSGKYKWHFQTTHHDLWDHDNPCPPVVVTLKQGGATIPAVAQVTKTGYCYILHRDTGKPIFGVKEVPAPPSDVPGEEAYPTQPIPVKPPALAKTHFTEDEATNISPETNEYVLKRLNELRHDGPYAPPSVRGTVTIPGFHGGATWSGASFDPTTGLLFVNTNNAPYISTLRESRPGHFDLTGYGYFLDQFGYPAIKPPWGMLTAIDVSKGEFAWQVTIGEFPELTARGIPQTGTENFGGTIVTAGGLVFIGGTKDEHFHAFDKSTGKLLWKYKLPAGGYATPCTYEVNGKQYVTIAAGGGGKQRTKSGDAFITFALP